MGISIWQLLIVLALVVLIFGTKKLRNIGGDVGSAVKSFKSAMKDGEADGADKQLNENKGETVEGETSKEKDKA